MIFSLSLKPGLKSILFTSLIALQITTIFDASANSGKKPNTDTNTNHEAVIRGTDSGSITEDDDPDGDNLLEVAAKLRINDRDKDENAFISAIAYGDYGTLIIDTTGKWIYIANNSQDVIQNLTGSDTLRDSLIVSSVDGTTHTITITIIGTDEPTAPLPVTNNPAVITGVDTGIITEDDDPDNDNLLEISGKLNITDSDAGEAAFTIAAVDGNYGSLTIDSTGNWDYAADNNQAIIQNLVANTTLTDSLTVSSIDGSTHTVVITIMGADEVLADISISWVAPAEREDLTALSLTEIAGYKIYYGSTQGQYTDNVTINDSTATTHTFTNLSSGTYYFVITTFDTAGRESRYSAEVAKAI